MPGGDQDHQLHSSSSHYERTYKLSSQECQEYINIISFIPATMRGLTNCQAKNATSISNVYHVPHFVTVKRSCQYGTITEPTLQDLLPVEQCITTIIHGPLMLFSLPIPSQHSLGTNDSHLIANDFQMEGLFDLPQYVETTLQFPFAFECTDLPIVAMILDILFECKPGLSCNATMSGESESRD
jgi:hypothetical protein